MESGASLEEIAQGNKAIKYTAALSGEDWKNIFQANGPYTLNLTEENMGNNCELIVIWQDFLNKIVLVLTLIRSTINNGTSKS